MSTQVQPPPSTVPAEPPAAPPPHHTKGPTALVIGAVVVLIVMLVVGILPRLKQRAALAEGVKQVKTAVLEVTVVKPKLVADPGISLPGNIQAINETAINARSTGYLRQLFVDIGSHVKAGQVLGIVQSPDVDQQVYQAEAQTAQSRATVGQSKANVAQQQATVMQDKADVARQLATIQQARQAVASAQAQVAQFTAAEKGAESGSAHARQALAVQRAALAQAQAQLDLAKVTNTRYQDLLKQGFVAQQDADQAAATFKTATAAAQSAQASVDAAQADVESALQAVSSAKANVVAAQANAQSAIENVHANEAALASSQAVVQAAQNAVQANLETVNANQAAVTSNVANARRFAVMRGFEKIVAPFDGVITARNVDVGTLISAGGTETGSTTSVPQTGMLGLARMDTVRIQVNVPQTYVPALNAGSRARVTVQELPGRVFTGIVSLRAGGLDAASRTQLVEVHVPNPDGALVTGMYAQVRIVPIHPPQTLRIPGTALVVDANGTRVAVVDAKHKVHFQPVVVGRDFGAEVEILSGLQGNETLANNPPDTLQDKAKVQIVKPARAAGGKGGKKRDDSE